MKKGKSKKSAIMKKISRQKNPAQNKKAQPREYVQRNDALSQVMAVKEISSTMLGKAIGRCQPTIDKYRAEPWRINAKFRKLISEHMEIDLSIMDAICNGEITNIAQVIERQKSLKTA